MNRIRDAADVVLVQAVHDFRNALAPGSTLMRLVIFGVSNVLGSILDCALATGLEPSLIVMNTPEALRAPDLRERFAAQGVTPVGNTPRELAAHMQAELVRTRNIVRQAGIPIEK